LEYFDINSISELHEFYGYAKPLHPLISIIDLTKVDRSRRKKGETHYRLGFYSASCKRVNGTLKYGRTIYDFSEGSLTFTSPRQVITPDPDITVLEGWGLYIHPNFLYGSTQGQKISGHSFFGYDIHEALHVSDAEKRILESCLWNIQREIANSPDMHSQALILGNLELYFGYCTRFYDRQFLTRTIQNRDALQAFDRLLQDYFNQESLVNSGLPEVRNFARQLNMSPNYLTDLLHRNTGKTTQEHIYLKLIDKAKFLLWGTTSTISEIAFDLGFEHPSHFSKLFKSKTGLSPKEFRKGKN
jgi:AraC family transcriptional activator of pobA